MEEGRAEKEGQVNTGGTVRDWQGKISFEKTLGTAATSHWYQLSLPSMLWRQHGDKIREIVVLQSVEDRKIWTVKTRIFFRGTYSQVVFQNGWKAFVVADGLVKGDQVKFTLTARSKFQVLIIRSGAEPKVPSVQSPKFKSEESAFRQRQPRMALGRHCLNLINKSSVESERQVNGLAAKNGTIEDSVAHSAYNTPGTSGRTSDMDSHFFEPIMQRDEQEAWSKSFNWYAQSQTAQFPSFCKRISGRNSLEIPCRFLESHWTQIGATYVKLQGIHETSKVHNVMCTSVMDRGRPRLSFKSCCWNDFVKDNCLQMGQKLSFTLTGDSFFVVRNA